MKLDYSIAEFFFIIIPGLWFILLLEYLFNVSDLLQIKLPKNDILLMLILLTLSMIIGFLLHAVTKIVKSRFIEDKVFAELKEKDSKNVEIAKEIFEEAKIFNKGVQLDVNELKRFFFLLNNYVWAKDLQFPSFVFAQRLVFWGNIFVATFVASFMIIFSYLCELCRNKASIHGDNFFASFFLLAIASLSFVMFRKHVYSLYSTILSTFVAIRKLDKN